MTYPLGAPVSTHEWIDLIREGKLIAHGITCANRLHEEDREAEWYAVWMYNLYPYCTECAAILAKKDENVEACDVIILKAAIFPE